MSRSVRKNSSVVKPGRKAILSISDIVGKLDFKTEKQKTFHKKHTKKKKKKKRKKWFYQRITVREMT